MRRISRLERRNILNGWIKWSLLPALLFSVLFFDAWLNVRIRHKDYTLSQLNAERRELHQQLHEAGAEAARLNGVEHLAVMAQEFGLASPSTQQFEAVAYREAPRRLRATEPVMAVMAAPAPVAIALNSSAPTPAPPMPLPEVAAANPVPPENIARDAASSEVGLEQADPELSILTLDHMLGKL